MSDRKPPLSVANARGRVAALTRSRSATDPDLVKARATLKAANLEEYVARAVAEAPPLTDEQRERIANLLGYRPGAAVSRIDTERQEAERKAELQRTSDARRNKAIAEALLECRVCCRPSAAHTVGEHKHEPLRADEVQPVIDAVNKKWSAK